MIIILGKEREGVATQDTTLIDRSVDDDDNDWFVSVITGTQVMFDPTSCCIGMIGIMNLFFLNDISFCGLSSLPLTLVHPNRL